MPDNKISSSKREIYTKLLDIAEKYTDIKNTDFLKTGLFGYMTESMAMMMRDSTIHKSMLYNESFLNTAMLPKSVYNWAKMFNIEVQKAKPKYAEIDIVIPSDSISNFLKLGLTDAEKERYGLTEQDVGEGGFIILNKEDPIVASDYYFSLEHSILIKYNVINNIYSARYITTEYVSTSFQTINRTNLILKNDGKNIVIKARAYQYRRSSHIRQINSTSFLNKIQKFTFEDQFCGAKLFYKENGVKTEVDLKYSEMEKGLNNNVAFYNLIDSNQLQINFKIGEGYFIPSSNTTIEVVIYTTKGLKAPSIFNGDALIFFSDTDLKALPLIVQFNPTTLMGGMDSPSISDIKKTIISEISTRNTITTKADLENYFSILTALTEDVNNGKIKFIKKRDDIIKRMYNAYLLLRDNVDDSKEEMVINTQTLSACVPTNTMNVKLSLDSLDDLAQKSFNYNFPAFDMAGNNLSSTNNAKDYYISPFNIFISTYPVNFVKFIYNLTNSESDCSYATETLNDRLHEELNGFYIIPNKLTLFRGFEDEGYKASNKYILTLNTTTNFPVGISDTDVPPLSFGGTIDVVGSASSITLSTKDIEVESHVTEEKGIYSTDIKMYITVGSPEFYFFPSNTLADGIATTDLYCNSIRLCGSNGAPSSFSDKEKFKISLERFTIQDIETKLVLNSNDSLQIYTQLDDIMESSLIHNSSSGDSNIYPLALTDVPLVHSSFFDNNISSGDRRRGFIEQLFTYINLLKDNLDRLETSTFFNLKFYNTYGVSNLYNTSNTNIKLRLIVHLNNADHMNNENLKAEIKSYIRKLVDNMNNDNSFNYSALNSAICSSETYGNYIRNVEFVGLNGTFNQYIGRLSINNDIYTPEWLNLDAKTLISGSDSGISFVFDSNSQNTTSLTNK